MKTIPAILITGDVPDQLARARDLLKWCRQLDGTEVEHIAVSAGYNDTFLTKYSYNRANCLPAKMLRLAATLYAGKPFMWLEPDSIPIRPGWLRHMTAAYYKEGKEFLMPALDESQKHDKGWRGEFGSGIGIYGPNTHWRVPDEFPTWGWDKFIYDDLNRLGLVAFTGLVQHSYCDYDNEDRPYLFPRDLDVLKPETEVFHADKHQSLIGYTQ